MRPKSVQTATNDYTLFWGVHVVTPQLQGIRSVIQLTAGHRLTGSAGLHRVAPVCESVSRRTEFKSNRIGIVCTNRRTCRGTVAHTRSIITGHRAFPGLTVGNVISGDDTTRIGGCSTVYGPRVLEID